MNKEQITRKEWLSLHQHGRGAGMPISIDANEISEYLVDDLGVVLIVMKNGNSYRVEEDYYELQSAILQEELDD